MDHLNNADFPAVADLLEEYADAIRDIKEALGSEQAEGDDSIFLLRYCMSYADTREAAEAVLFARRYRAENNSWLSIC